MPADTDGDGIADFMEAGEPETITVTENPAWAWGAVIAAIVLGILAAMGFMRGGKPEGVGEAAEPEAEGIFEKESPKVPGQTDNLEWP